MRHVAVTKLSVSAIHQDAKLASVDEQNLATTVTPRACPSGGLVAIEEPK